MISRLLALILFGSLIASWSPSAIAQDLTLAEEPAAPELLGEHSPAADPGEVGGLAAVSGTAQVIVATQALDGRSPRGGWALNLSEVGAETPCVFEFAAAGYSPPQFKVKYLGTGGSGVNLFHYYQVMGYQAQMAIRNRATGGSFDQYIIRTDNGEVIEYGDGFAYPPAN